MRPLLLAMLILAASSPGSADASRQEAAPGPDVLAEVRVHGNHATPDAEVLRIAALSIGQPLSPADIDAAAERLRKSGRFEAVEIRKRYRTLSGTGDVALIVLVREHPVPDETLQATPAPLRPFRRFMASGMFLPVLSYNDGYGFTYGVRLSFVNVLGGTSRVSVPLTWGGTKRAAVEAERTIARGPVDRLTASASVWRRTNPFAELDENRRDVSVGASRALGQAVRVGVQGAYANVRFGGLEERLASYGANLTLDTRQDPVFPRNAVYAEASWTGLEPAMSAPVNRWRVELRGYRGLVRQSVLSLRWQYAGADGPLPPYERFLLGGAGALRGYRTGSFWGDNLMAASAEVRVPLSSPMGIAHAGVTAFTDVGTVWDHGTRVGDARFRAGFGGGVFLLASLFQLSLDVGIRQDGGARVHFSTGLQF